MSTSPAEMANAPDGPLRRMAEEAITNTIVLERKNQIEGLGKLQAPFLPHQIGHKPSMSKDQSKCDPKFKINCPICKGWHHAKAKHLEFVGHAALTNRLLQVDPAWSWEPAMVDPETGGPKFDRNNGIWIKLTVLGVTRMGYGDGPIPGTQGGREIKIGDSIKEAIGDALRNAGMRFGIGLDLWHKGALNVDEEMPREIDDSDEDIDPETGEIIPNEPVKPWFSQRDLAGFTPKIGVEIGKGKTIKQIIDALEKKYKISAAFIKKLESVATNPANTTVSGDQQ